LGPATISPATSGSTGTTPIGALDAFGGAERTIDVGSVNGRLFLNNASLGAYAQLVHRREHRRRRRAALARVRALWVTARERHGLRATVDGRPVEARVIFVGNNTLLACQLDFSAKEFYQALSNT